MKFTLAWLKDFLDSDASLEEISARLTELGLEVEEVTSRQDLSPFIIEEIVMAQPHPDADKLRICKTSKGEQVICGAPNARAGIKVVMAKPGMVVPANQMVIKEAKIRGVDSQGMFCSARELMLGEDHDGIMELPQDAPVGGNFAAYMGLDDPVIEIAITPNRGDCLGVYGIARDLAASGIGKLKELQIPERKPSFNSKIAISRETEDCRYFLLQELRISENGESPLWLQNRLRAIGMNPISTLVDITNYINISFGRPLHVYDADKISGNFTIKSAKGGEKFQALNGEEYEVVAKAIMISDEEDIQAIGGVIGGEASSATSNTRRVFLEAAYFDPIVTSLTSRHMGIITDSSYRFERGVDPSFTRKGLMLAAGMISDLCGEVELSHIVESGEAGNEERIVSFTENQIAELAGNEFTKAEIKDILSSLGFKIIDESWKVIVPSWRHDITIWQDIVEELLRIRGYDKIEKMPFERGDVKEGALSAVNVFAMKARRLLATRGMDEVITWSFMNEKKAKHFQSLEDSLRLVNPISQEMAYMRPVILSNLLDIIASNNARSIKSMAIFEVGPVYYNIDKQAKVISGVRNYQHDRRNHYSPVRSVDFFDIKADVFALLSESGLEKLPLMAEGPDYYHPGKVATIKLGPKTIAHFGELHPKLVNIYEVKGPVVAFELFIDNLPLSSKRKNTSLEISNYQPVERDFAFIIPEDYYVGELTKIVKALDKNLIKDVYIFDIYNNIEKGCKSVAINVMLQANDHSLSEEEIKAISDKIIDNVRKIGGRLR